MEHVDNVKQYIQRLKPVKIDAALIKRICGLIDLTSLNSDDNEASVAAFCQKANTSFGHVAAVCVYPQFVKLVADNFRGTAIKTATVVNFPQGNNSLEDALIEINHAIEDGATEIDVVFPYQRYLAGERQYAQDFVRACKAACGNHVLLKVILETGALNDIHIIANATKDVLLAGADFVKTSTGKIAQGATLEAATTMLLVIKDIEPQLKRRVGLKISGGVRTFEQVAAYIQLADEIMSHAWVSSATFRIGASKLIDEIEAWF